MEKIEDTEIDIDDIGAILKSSRLKSKKSLEEISSELCIRKIYLTALEEGDYETLPPIPYGVGYVRTYANYLGLNPERAVKLYKSASITESAEKPEEVEVVPPANKSNKWHIIAGVAVLLVVYGIWSLSTRNSTPKEEENIDQIEAVAEDSAIIEESNKVEAVALAEEEVTETEAEEISEEKAAPKASKTEKEPKLTINKKNITLVFTGDCWAKLQDKKKVYLERVYHKDDVREIPYTPNLFLSVGVPENVKVYIKGVEKNIIVTKKKMNIPLDSLN